MTHPLPPLKRGDEFVPEILRRDAPLDDNERGLQKEKNSVYSVVQELRTYNS